MGTGVRTVAILKPNLMGKNKQGPEQRPFRVGYSSFPDWSTLGEIRELEIERGNEFPDVPHNPSWPAKWVAESKIVAYSYVVLAKDAERIQLGELTKRERRHMERSVYEIQVEDGDIFLTCDGDGGYLVVRPERGPIRSDDL